MVCMYLLHEVIYYIIKNRYLSFFILGEEGPHSMNLLRVSNGIVMPLIGNIDIINWNISYEHPVYNEWRHKLILGFQGSSVIKIFVNYNLLWSSSFIFDVKVLNIKKQYNMKVKSPWFHVKRFLSTSWSYILQLMYYLKGTTTGNNPSVPQV